MSTNLRLSDELVGALRAAAERSGRSQQDILREALARQLGLASDVTDLQRAVQAGLVQAPEPFCDAVPTLTLPAQTSTLDLLDREDR